MLIFEKAPLTPVQGEDVPFLDQWHIRQVEGPDGTRYEVRDSKGAVVARDIKHIEHARLFARAPELISHFDDLTREAGRALNFMVDVQEGLLDIEEVAEDVVGRWEDICSDAPRFAGWLLDINDLRSSIGDQHPVVGVARQAPLDLREMG